MHLPLKAIPGITWKRIQRVLRRQTPGCLRAFFLVKRVFTENLHLMGDFKRDIFIWVHGSLDLGVLTPLKKCCFTQCRHRICILHGHVLPCAMVFSAWDFSFHPARTISSWVLVVIYPCALPEESQAYTMWFFEAANPNDATSARWGHNRSESCNLHHHHKESVFFPRIFIP